MFQVLGTTPLAKDFVIFGVGISLPGYQLLVQSRQQIGIPPFGGRVVQLCRIEDHRRFNYPLTLGVKFPEKMVADTDIRFTLRHLGEHFLQCIGMNDLIANAKTGQQFLEKAFLNRALQ